MNELIARSLQGCTSEEEEARLWRWRKERTEREESYQRVAAVWRATRSYEPRVRSQPPTHETVLLEAARWQGGRGRGVGWGRSAGIAAALVVGLAIGMFTSNGRMTPAPGGELLTGAGETATARLRDGTMVRLAPESRLVLPPGGVEREVMLVGRAFFAVAADRERPFVVRTSAGEARVLGTRFEVNARERDLRLVVLEGRVAVTAGGKEVELGSHQVSHVRDGAEPSVVEVDDVWPLMEWMGGFMAFESTPLAEVGREMERRFGLKLEIEDAELSRQTVTVWFADEPLDRVVSMLCQLVEARCAVEGSIIRVSSM